MAVKLTIPDLGDFEDVEVIEVLASPGDVVEVEDPLITLETDKALLTNLIAYYCVLEGIFFYCGFTQILVHARTISHRANNQRLIFRLFRFLQCSMEERCAVNPHPMHDDSKLASNRNQSASATFGLY